MEKKKKTNVLVDSKTARANAEERTGTGPHHANGRERR